MTTYSDPHRENCGRDGTPCPTGEHGFCPGCAGEIPVNAPINLHDNGCPSVQHCPGCLPGAEQRGRDGEGHRDDCPCAYDNHQVPAVLVWPFPFADYGLWDNRTGRFMSHGWTHKDAVSLAAAYNRCYASSRRATVHLLPQVTTD